MSKPILDEIRDILRRRHYSIRTEKRYCNWVERYIKHFNIKTPFIGVAARPSLSLQMLAHRKQTRES